MFVYMTICKINGKKYIGKYEGSEHHPYLGSGKLLQRAIKKYGKDAFERVILERYQDVSACREGEKKWIALFEAVQSKDFYNIAQGGEGGNTFAGIQGADRVKLFAKLKLRRRGASKAGNTLCWSVLEHKSVYVPVEQFKTNPYLIGTASRGVYITPQGIYCSAFDASKANKLEMSSLIKRCRNSCRLVNNNHIASDPYNLCRGDLKQNLLQFRMGLCTQGRYYCRVHKQQSYSKMRYLSTKFFDNYSVALRQWKSQHSHCSKLHGYSLKFKVWFASNEPDVDKQLDDTNWIQDYSGFKSAPKGNGLKDWMDHMWDHTTLIQKDDPYADIFVQMEQMGLCKLHLLDKMGAESCAKIVFDKFNDVLSKTDAGRCKVIKVECFENDNNSSIYEEV